MQMLEQIFEMLFKTVEAILRFSVESLEFVLTGKVKQQHSYKAEFAPSWSLLSSWNTGFCLTGARNLSTKDSYQNALVVGGTGTGKSSVTLLPSLYTMNSSFIVHDPSGELFLKSAGALSARGYAVKILNFANPEISSGYNPLHRARTSSEIQKVASMLIENALGGEKKDPFWNNTAVLLLSLLIRILKNQPDEYYTLYNVRQLLNKMGGSPKTVDRLFSEYADDILFDEYKSFLAYDDKVRNGSLATVKAALQIFSDEAVARVTSIDTIDFYDFRRGKVALFIQNSVAEQKYYSVITSIFFEQFFNFLLSRFPQNAEQDVFLLIDEASSLKLPTLPLATANVRKHRAGIMLIVQDFSQLIHNFGKYEAEAIKANCFAKMYFTGAGLETARELEQVLGKFQYEDEDKKTITRELMTRDEIRTMRMNEAILICGHHSPVRARLVPYYQRWKYRAASQLPASYMQTEVPENIPLLSILMPDEEDEE